MTAYSDQELERMLVALETDLVERKESFRGDAAEPTRSPVLAETQGTGSIESAPPTFVSLG